MLIGFFVGIILKTVHSEGIKEALIFWGQALAFFLMAMIGTVLLVVERIV